jgi:hypothetical protein
LSRLLTPHGPVPLAKGKRQRTPVTVVDHVARHSGDFNRLKPELVKAGGQRERTNLVDAARWLDGDHLHRVSVETMVQVALTVERRYFKADAVFVFQMSSSLITSPNSTVSLVNGANACSVQWQVSSSATIDTGTTFVGNILALTSITMNSAANLTGRALARNGAVTLNNNTISFALCGAGGGAGGAPPPFPPVGVPTLPEVGKLALLVILLSSGAYFVSRRKRATNGYQ